MAFTKRRNEIFTLILMLAYTPSLVSASIDCKGRSFHCVNSTHFMICVDFGDGILSTVDDYAIPCPRTAVCKPTNRFECEFPPVTTPAPTIRTTLVTNEPEIATTLSWIEIIGNTKTPLVKTYAEHNILNNPTTISTTPSPDLITTVNSSDFTNKTVDTIIINPKPTKAEIVVTPNGLTVDNATFGDQQKTDNSRGNNASVPETSNNITTSEPILTPITDSTQLSTIDKNVDTSTIANNDILLSVGNKSSLERTLNNVNNSLVNHPKATSVPEMSMTDIKNDSVTLSTQQGESFNSTNIIQSSGVNETSPDITKPLPVETVINTTTTPEYSATFDNSSNSVQTQNLVTPIDIVTTTDEGITTPLNTADDSFQVPTEPFKISPEIKTSLVESMTNVTANNNLTLDSNNAILGPNAQSQTEAMNNFVVTTEPLIVQTNPEIESTVTDLINNNTTQTLLLELEINKTSKLNVSQVTVKPSLLQTENETAVLKFDVITNNTTELPVSNISQVTKEESNSGIDTPLLDLNITDVTSKNDLIVNNVSKSTVLPVQAPSKTDVIQISNGTITSNSDIITNNSTNVLLDSKNKLSKRNDHYEPEEYNFETINLDAETSFTELFMNDTTEIPTEPKIVQSNSRTDSPFVNITVNDTTSKSELQINKISQLHDVSPNPEKIDPVAASTEPNVVQINQMPLDSSITNSTMLIETKNNTQLSASNVSQIIGGNDFQGLVESSSMPTNLAKESSSTDLLINNGTTELPTDPNVVQSNTGTDSPLKDLIINENSQILPLDSKSELTRSESNSSLVTERIDTKVEVAQPTIIHINNGTGEQTSDSIVHTSKNLPSDTNNIFESNVSKVSEGNDFNGTIIIKNSTGTEKPIIDLLINSTTGTSTGHNVVETNSGTDSALFELNINRTSVSNASQGNERTDINQMPTDSDTIPTDNGIKLPKTDSIINNTRDLQLDPKNKISVSNMTQVIEENYNKGPTEPIVILTIPETESPFTNLFVNDLKITTESYLVHTGQRRESSVLGSITNNTTDTALLDSNSDNKIHKMSQSNESHFIEQTSRGSILTETKVIEGIVLVFSTEATPTTMIDLMNTSETLSLEYHKNEQNINELPSTNVTQVSEQANNKETIDSTGEQILTSKSNETSTKTANSKLPTISTEKYKTSNSTFNENFTNNENTNMFPETKSASETTQSPPINGSSIAGDVNVNMAVSTVTEVDETALFPTTENVTITDKINTNGTSTKSFVSISLNKSLNIPTRTPSLLIETSTSQTPYGNSETPSYKDTSIHATLKEEFASITENSTLHSSNPNNVQIQEASNIETIQISTSQPIDNTVSPVIRHEDSKNNTNETNPNLNSIDLNAKEIINDLTKINYTLNKPTTEKSFAPITNGVNSNDSNIDNTLKPEGNNYLDSSVSENEIVKGQTSSVDLTILDSRNIQDTKHHQITFTEKSSGTIASPNGDSIVEHTSKNVPIDLATTFRPRETVQNNTVGSTLFTEATTKGPEIIQESLPEPSPIFVPENFPKPTHGYEIFSHSTSTNEPLKPVSTTIAEIELSKNIDEKTISTSSSTWDKSIDKDRASLNNKNSVKIQDITLTIANQQIELTSPVSQPTTTTQVPVAGTVPHASLVVTKSPSITPVFVDKSSTDSVSNNYSNNKQTQIHSTNPQESFTNYYSVTEKMTVTAAATPSIDAGKTNRDNVDKTDTIILQISGTNSANSNNYFVSETEEKTKVDNDVENSKLSQTESITPATPATLDSSKTTNEVPQGNYDNSVPPVSSTKTYVTATEKSSLFTSGSPSMVITSHSFSSVTTRKVNTDNIEIFTKSSDSTQAISTKPYVPVTTQTISFTTTTKPTTPKIENINDNKGFPAALPGFSCKGKPRGKYGDEHDCRKYYICSGRIDPIIGHCPNTSVFSENRASCVKNLSHCIRNNQFKCATQGRFSDFHSPSTYYICVQNNRDSFIRFKFQCQGGYHLNKTSVKCMKDVEVIDQSNQSVSTDSNSADINDGKTTNDKIVNKKKKKGLRCEKEGIFADPDNCRKYYICTLKSSEYRLRKKKCDSDEVFDKHKKECVDEESYECS